MLKTFKKLDWFLRRKILYTGGHHCTAQLWIYPDPPYGRAFGGSHHAGADRSALSVSRNRVFADRDCGGLYSELFLELLSVSGAARIGYWTRLRLMRKFLVRPRSYENNSTGSLMGKSTNDVNAARLAGFG